MAKPKTQSIQELARSSGLDLEVVLVALWGEGIDYVNEPGDRVLLHDVARAQRAVGIAGSRKRLVSYWEIELGLAREGIAELLAEGGYSLHARARTLPKGAVRLLQRYQDAPEGITIAQTLTPSADERPHEPLEWRQVGHMPPKEHLCVEDVLSIHFALERDFAAAADPISPAGVKSPDMLASALERPQTSFLGSPKYETLVMCGAALVHSLIHNHPFHNGNKRTALVSLLVLLDRNDVVLESDEQELFRFFLQVASHALLTNDRIYESVADREVLEIARWINQRTRVLERGERIIPWRILHRILRDMGCEIRQHRGDKLRITRSVVEKPGAWFRAPQERVLTSYFTNTGDGREVPKALLKRLRTELESDEAHGVDSAKFYVQRREPDVFISEYSRLLKRLARV